MEREASHVSTTTAHRARPAASVKTASWLMNQEMVFHAPLGIEIQRLALRMRTIIREWLASRATMMKAAGHTRLFHAHRR